MKAKAWIRDKKGNVIADEIIELSDAAMYGRTPEEIEQLTANYISNWSRKHIDIGWDIIDPNSGMYPHIDWEKRD